MCHGKKIPSVKHGKFTCKRNVDGEGKKKGKAKPANNGVLKCSKKPGNGWKAKPGVLRCDK